MLITYAEGLYIGEIKEAKLTESSGGTPGFAIRFTVKRFGDGETEEVDRQYDRTAYRYLTEKTIDFATKELRALGYDRDNFRELDQSAPNAFPLIGCMATFYCKHESFQGSQREKWNIAAGGASEIKPIDQAKARKLDALFGKALKDAPIQATPRVERAKASTPVEVGPPPTENWIPSDEDVPF